MSEQIEGVPVTDEEVEKLAQQLAIPDTEIVIQNVNLGSIVVSGPVALLRQATQVSLAWSKVVRSLELSKVIQKKEFIYASGWEILGGMLGVIAKETRSEELSDGHPWEFESEVDLIRVSDGKVIGHGSAIVSEDEESYQNSSKYEKFQLKSKATTRATGKAFRISFGWMAELVGFSSTPLDEILEGQTLQPQGGVGKKAQKPPAQKVAYNLDDPLSLPHSTPEESRKFHVMYRDRLGVTKEEFVEALKKEGKKFDDLSWDRIITITQDIALSKPASADDDEVAVDPE